jgi:hypothetical protein
VSHFIPTNQILSVVAKPDFIAQSAGPKTSNSYG